MAQIRSSRWWGGLTTMLAIAFVVGVALLMDWNLGGLRGGSTSPEESPTASVPSPTVAAGPVSAPDEAIPLTTTILHSVEPGWILTTYDSSSGRYLSASERAPRPSLTPEVSSAGSEERFWDHEGTRRVYVVDRTGTVYEGADLGASSGLELRLWLPGNRAAIVARPEHPGSNRVVLFAFDIVTGALSAPFDGPAAAPRFTGSVASPSASPSATPTPVAEASPIWTGGEVRLSASGDAILVADGEGTRQWIRLSFGGRALAQVIPPVVAMSFVENPTGASYAAGERVETTSQRWVEEDLEWIDVIEVSWNTIIYSATPEGDPESDRMDVGAPPEDARCRPLSWAPERQLLDACVRADSTTVLYTVSPRTNTFVKAAVFPTTASDPFFSVKPDATRVAVGRTVYSIVGEVAWELEPSDPTPTGITWSGGLFVAWGDRAAVSHPGYGAPEIRVHDAFDGESVYRLISRQGEAGFGPVLPSH